MSDFTLHDKTEIDFDLSKMTYGEWRGMFDPKQPEHVADEILARVAGITMEKLESCDYIEFKRLFSAFLKKTREPLSDPNA